MSKDKVELFKSQEQEYHYLEYYHIYSKTALIWGGKWPVENRTGPKH